MVNITDGIKKKIFYKAREYVKYYLTHKLGRVVEDEDKLIVFVSAKRIFGVGTLRLIKKPDYDKLVDIYDLDKRIVYYFADLDLEYYLRDIFVREKCDIVFDNCKLPPGIAINGNSETNILFNNCKTLGSLTVNSANIVCVKKPFMPYVDEMDIYANKIVLEGIDDRNTSLTVDKRSYDFLAKEKMEITNSFIGNKSFNTSIIAEKEIDVINSSIGGLSVHLEADNIAFDKKSYISTNGKVDVVSQNETSIAFLKPEVYINGKRMDSKDYCKRITKG